MWIYNLIEYSLSCFDATVSLWLYLKNETTNFDHFRFFKYKAKLLGKTKASGANGIPKNAPIAVPFKCPGKFSRSLEILLIAKWN